MINNTRNRSNDTTEAEKEKGPVLMLIFSTVSVNSVNSVFGHFSRSEKFLFSETLNDTSRIKSLAFGASFFPSKFLEIVTVFSNLFATKEIA